MSDPQRIEAAIEDATGSPFRIASQQAIGGGCINDAVRLRGDDRSFFMKANRLDFYDAFATEAEALRQIAATRSVRVPEVVALVKGERQAYLILEYIPTRPSRSGDWQALGRQLAALHRVEQPYFGWTRDNLIGATPQPNPRSNDWLAFFRQSRLEHQLRLCAERGYQLPHAERLLDAIPTFFQDYQPYPSLLHGDLWSGNAAFAEDGSPFLFDPASYYGDRETDLAFTEFFGGYAPAFYEAYQEALPLHSGYDQRKTLYNLYHCLNHLYLFGTSYAHQAETMARQLVDAAS